MFYTKSSSSSAIMNKANILILKFKQLWFRWGQKGEIIRINSDDFETKVIIEMTISRLVVISLSSSFHISRDRTERWRRREWRNNWWSRRYRCLLCFSWTYLWDLRYSSELEVHQWLAARTRRDLGYRYRCNRVHPLGLLGGKSMRKH